jgi:hypothetical protein
MDHTNIVRGSSNNTEHLFLFRSAFFSSCYCVLRLALSLCSQHPPSFLPLLSLILPSFSNHFYPKLRDPKLILSEALLSSATNSGLCISFSQIPRGNVLGDLHMPAGLFPQSLIDTSQRCPLSKALQFLQKDPVCCLRPIIAVGDSIICELLVGKEARKFEVQDTGDEIG